MNKINPITWKIFLLKDLFEIETGTDLIYNEQEEGVYPVIGHKELNHGVTCWIQKLSNRKLYDHNRVLSLGDRGCFISYVQPYDFYIGTRVKALILKYSKPNIFILTFISAIINNERYRFSYNRNATDKTPYLSIKLPSIWNSAGSYSPDWQFMEDYIKSLHFKPLTTNNHSPNNVHKLDTSAWKDFWLLDIFSYLEAGKVSNASILDAGNEVPYIGAKKENNGVVQLCADNPQKRSKGNCVVMICDGQGSVGFANYIDRDFLGTVNLMLGYNDKYINKYTGLFLAAILSQERFRYSFGRKWKPHINETKIKLPAIQNQDGSYNPNWNFMENYIKSLPYGDCI